MPAATALVAKGRSWGCSVVLVGVVQGPGRREKERGEIEAGPERAHRVMELGGALSMRRTGRGERGRRGSTVCRVPDVEVVLLARGGEARWPGGSGKGRLQCESAL